MKWKNVCIVTDDFNTNFLGDPMESTHRYKNPYMPFLYTNTSQKLQAKKSLIDHISSNMNNKFSTHVLRTDKISDGDTPYGVFNIKIER